MRKIVIRFSKLLLILSLVSCAGPSLIELVALADDIAISAGFKKRLFSTDQFQLVGYSKLTSKSGALSIYIEGDGKAWVTRWRPSLNPTPHNPFALKLASVDNQSENIIYLSRPCQYLNVKSAAECRRAYWLNKRYAQEVVDSYQQVIDQIIRKNNYSSINLIGFSGGGTLALLIASQRQDIASIRTVAGNIDTDAFTSYHKVSPMSGSLNPADYVQRLEKIPQIHFYGEYDLSVPRQIIQSYMQKLSVANCAKDLKVEKATHNQHWLTQWNILLKTRFPC